MRFSRTNMRLAAARLPDLSREIDAQAAEFSITHFCPRNPGLTKSTTYARETAKIGRSLFKSSLGTGLLFAALAAYLWWTVSRPLFELAGLMRRLASHDTDF